MVKVACLGFAGVLLCLFLKQSRSPYAEFISLATCILIIFYSLMRLYSVFDLFRALRRYLAVQDEFVRILLKIAGITYVADFSSSICKDAGYSAIAGQIEIFGKISVLAVSSPVILALLELVASFI